MLIVPGAGVWAGVSTDGTLGPARTLPGPSRVVPAELGTRRGANLFHSFKELSIARGESVTFTGPADVSRVLARVTGGSASRIDGTLGCTIDGASLFLINPSGVIFGGTARLDLRGSLVVSTADVVRLADGTAFASRPPSGGDVLTSAPVAAFGFLAPSAAGIAVRGAGDDRARLTVPDRSGLSIVGGGVEIERAGLRSSGGWLSLAAVAGAGTVEVAPDRPGLATSISEGATRATVSILDRSRVNLSGPLGGQLSILAGDVRVDRSAIDSASTGAAPGEQGAPLSIDSDGVVTLREARVATGSVSQTELAAADAGDVAVKARSLRVGTASVLGSAAITSLGNAGDVTVEAGEVVLRGAGTLEPGAGIAAGVIFGTGAAGAVTIRADSLTIRDGAEIEAQSLGSGSGGAITIEAGKVLVSAPTGGLPRGVRTNAAAAGGAAAGSGGSVNVTAGSLRVEGSGVITSSTQGEGPAGDVIISADELVLNSGTDPLSLVSATIEASSAATSTPAGAAGNVLISARRVRLLNGARLASGSTGFAPAGRVVVSARDLWIEGASGDFSRTSALSTSVLAGDAPGGRIVVDARRVRLVDGGAILANTNGTGPGGTVEVTARELTVTGTAADETPSILGASTTGDGSGGTLLINAGSLSVRNGGFVTAAAIAGNGDGGLLSIRAGDVIVDGGAKQRETVIGAGVIAGDLDEDPGTPILTPTGSGGSIDLRATGTVVVRRGGIVIAGTEGTGSGGDLSIAADRGITVSAGTISAASADLSDDGPPIGSGPAGSVVLSSPMIRLEQDGVISAQSDLGSGGSVTLAGDRVDLLGSAVSVNAATRGGSVTVRAPRRLFVFRSQINAVGGESIGKIDIDPEFTILNRSSLLTDTRPGGGGNIEIVTDQLLRDSTTITAAGEIRIDVLNADTDITAGLLELRGDFLDEAARLKDACGRQIEGIGSSFIVEGRGGVPWTPGEPLPTPHPAGP